VALRLVPRPYQVEPLRVFLERRNILLAFATGLGKTAVAIMAAEELIESGQIDVCLIVVPAGLKYQWAEAIARFTDLPTQTKRFKGETVTIPDSRHVMVIDGPPDRRKRQYKMARETPGCCYVITGLDNVESDTRDIKRVHAEFVILDEASAIKTLSAARTISIKTHLSDVPWRMALTATPIDNRPDELFSVMEWVDPSVLGRGDLFDHTYIERNAYGDPVGYRNLGILRKRLGTAMYRKSVDDPDVAPYMPDRRFLDWTYHMDTPTRDLYTRMAWDLKSALDAAIRGGASFNVTSHYAGGKHDESTDVGKVMAIHTAMEMLLDHPDLLVDSAMDYGDGNGKGSKYASVIYGSGALDDLAHSPKLKLMVDKMRTLMDDPASKVIIFTRYRWMLRLIVEYCASSGWQPSEYHGDLSTADQQASRARFLRDPRCRVFVSTHAGERGTDLPVANWLVNYDAVWSAGQADQINGRHMRTSSDHDRIFVANMYCPGTVEDRKLAQQAMKRKVSAAIIDGRMPRSGRIDNDVASLGKHVDAWLTHHDPDGMFSS
jgi:SNF2 family DNA or RNA helicase